MAFLSLVAVGLLGWLLFELVTRRWAREVLVEFQAEFPGVCPVCSFHTYQLQSGHDVPFLVPAHPCRGVSLALFGVEGDAAAPA